MEKKFAFTLAEVLITLGIIGIVAAMTMPSLITNYKKKQTVAQLQKAYTEISQAMKLAEVEHGFMDTWDFTSESGDFTGWGEENKKFLNEYLAPNLKFVKTCFPVTTECWQEVHSLDNSKHIDASNSTYWSIFSSAITTSGYSIYAWTSQDEHVQIYVDINGPKKGQSILGKDIFSLLVLLKEKKVVFKGTNLNEDAETVIRNNCNSSCIGPDAGLYCGALIQIDGWQIKDEYPW